MANRDRSLAEAVAIFRQGYLDQAAAVCHRLLRTNPQFSDALDLLATISSAEGNLGLGLELVRRAICGAPDQADLYQRQGIVLGKLGQAAPCQFFRAIRLDPSCAAACSNLGNLQNEAGDGPGAILSHKSAIINDPENFHFYYNTAISLRRSHRTTEATEHFRRCLSISIDFVPAYISLAELAYSSEQGAAAIECLKAAAILTPWDSAIITALAMQLGSFGEVQDGIRLCRLATRYQPDQAEPLDALGQGLARQAQPLAAKSVLERAIALDPTLSSAYGRLGPVHCDLDARQAALISLTRSIFVRPDCAENHNNLGNLLFGRNKAEDALRAYKTALICDPSGDAAFNGMSAVVRGRKDTGAAVACLVRALVISAQNTEAMHNLGALLRQTGKLARACAISRRAITLRPELAGSYAQAAAALLDQGDQAAALRLFSKSIRLDPSQDETYRAMLTATLYSDSLGNDQIRAIHQDYARHAALSKQSPGASGAPRQRRLRIGYLSSDLHRHPVTDSLLPLVRLHDRASLSIHFYSHGTTCDPVTAELQAMADSWCDITGMSDAEAALRIRRDAIDVLVFLSGHFDRNRPRIAVHRAAPVQISLFDVATSGLAEMDYLIADNHLVPRHGDEFFSERVLRVPCIHILEPPVNLPDIEDDRGDGQLTFGCFNNPSKISPTCLVTWGKILAGCPDARIILKYMDRYNEPEVCKYISSQLREYGAGRDQIMFLTGKEPLPEFLARYNDIDIALDSFPFSGSTTSFQALAMGVPVVTWPWERMAGRWTAAMLRAVDLPDLIASSASDYVAKALRLAGERHLWRQRRRMIRRRLVESRLCRTAPRARQIERLYHAAWQYHCRSTPSGA